MTVEPTLNSKGEWKEGWPVVVSAMGGMSLTPLALYTLGLFIEPLQREFGWSRAAISSGLTVNAVVAVTLAPFAGMLVDRMGPRRIGIFGVVFFCAAFALLASSTGSLAQWRLLWLLIGLGALALKPTVWLSAVTSRFHRARGMAVSMTMMGTSITAILAPLIAAPLMERFGWRAAYVVLAVLWGAIVLPLVLAFFYGLRDLIRIRNETAGPISPKYLEGATAREAFLSANFIKLTTACLMSYFAVVGLAVHLVPILTAAGIDRSRAAVLASVLGISAMAGRLFAGYWMDRHNPRIFGAIIFGMPAIASSILLGDNIGLFAALMAAIILGIASGTEFEVASILLSRTFGIRRFGLLMGTIVGLLALIGGISPWVFGYVYDHHSTYFPALLLVLPLSATAGLLIFWMKDQANRSSSWAGLARQDHIEPTLTNQTVGSK